jgi:hypothetical protein
MRQSPTDKDISTKGGKSTLLGAVTRQWLVKTENFMCTAVQRSVECVDRWNICLPVVTSCKCSVTPVINPTPCLVTNT